MKSRGLGRSAMTKVELFFEVEGLRINVRAILARLELLCGGRPTLAAVGPYDFVVRDEAGRQGWPLARGRQEAATLVWFAPGDEVGGESVAHTMALYPAVETLCIVRHCPGSVDARLPRGYTSWSRPFSPNYSLGHYTHFLARWIRLPRPVIRAAAGLLKALGLSQAVGARFFRLRLRCNEEFYIARQGADGVTAAPATRWDPRDLAMAFFGCGHVPVAPGTVASLVTAAGLYCLAVAAPIWWQFAAAALAAVATAAAAALERWSEKYYFAKDARQVVLDEVAGQSLALCLLPLPATPEGFAAAFLAFRVFDVLKPGVHWIEKRRWPGTIVWDDLLAGVYAGVVLLGMRAAGVWPFPNA